MTSLEKRERPELDAALKSESLESASAAQQGAAGGHPAAPSAAERQVVRQRGGSMEVERRRPGSGPAMQH